jgi:hypothetical protein
MKRSHDSGYATVLECATARSAEQSWFVAGDGFDACEVRALHGGADRQRYTAEPSSTSERGSSI